MAFVLALTIFISAYTDVPQAWIATCDGGQFPVEAVAHENGVATWFVEYDGNVKAWGIYNPILLWTSSGQCGEMENLHYIDDYVPWKPEEQPSTHSVWLPMIGG